MIGIYRKCVKLLSFALYEMSTNKSVREKLNADVRRFENLSYENIQQMVYLDAFLKGIQSNSFFF